MYYLDVDGVALVAMSSNNKPPTSEHEALKFIIDRAEAACFANHLKCAGPEQAMPEVPTEQERAMLDVLECLRWFELKT